jgi:hypothetical protein
MLSPGHWHRLVPKSRTANLRFRLNLLRLCRRSRKCREAVREACRTDFLFWVNAFVWQYNPRKKAEGEVGPFITWDFQDDGSLEILRCIEEDDDVVIEKSREMGASWLCLLVILWLYLYHPWKKFLVISRSEAAVEDDDPDSLFWKLDFVITYLPKWLMPRGWDKKQHRRKLYFGSPNGSTITGQASTGRAGVGGRATAMFIDEFSQIKEDFEVLHRTSDTTGCRVFNGTHRGTGTAFHELTERVDMKKIVMHWTQHPDKRPGLYRWNQKLNKADILDGTFHYAPDFTFVQTEAPAGGPHPGLRSPWYDRECLRKGSPRAVAMDLDIDAGGSVSQFFNPVTLKVLRETYCCDPAWIGDIDYDQETGRPLGLVKREGGAFRLWAQPVTEGSVQRMPRSLYGVGGDLSTGTGATNSCLSFLDGRTGEKVAEYSTPHISPDRFAPLALALCWLFRDEEDNPALFGWENAGPGLIFGKRVLEIGYPRVWWRESGGQVHNGKVTRQPGWYPSLDAKRLLLEAYRAALDCRKFINRSEWALKQCAPYRYNASGHPEHPSDAKAEDHTGARTNHGDMAIADALAWKMAESFGMIGPRKSTQTSQAPVGSLAWRRLIASQSGRDSWDEAPA